MKKEELIKCVVEYINELNKGLIRDNKNLIDVCFIAAIIDQQYEKFVSMVSDLSDKKVDIRYHRSKHFSKFGSITIHPFKPDSEIVEDSTPWRERFLDYHYEIEIFMDERDWGYCQCKSSDPGYNEKYFCCGNGCDWSAPAMRVQKIFDLGVAVWDGFEKDYWAYKEQFETDEANRNAELEEMKRQDEIDSIVRRMNELKIRLDELGGE